MQINSNDRYLSLVITALEELVMPELRTSSAQTSAAMIRSILTELRKRETTAPKMLQECIDEGDKLALKIAKLLDCTHEGVHLGQCASFAELSERYSKLTATLATLCKKLLCSDVAKEEIIDMLRRAAEWELAYYTRDAQLPLPTDKVPTGKGVALSKGLLEDFINNLRSPEQGVISLEKFEPLTGGFGKQTYLCTYYDQGELHELVVRKSDPMPVMMRGACLLDNEHSLLGALASTDYPSPRPIAYAANWKGVDGDFYIMKRNGGEAPGEFLHGMKQTMPERVFLELAEMLARLHQIPLATFSDYASKYDSPDIINGSVADAYRLNLSAWANYLEEQVHLPSPYLLWLMNWLESNIPQDTRPPVLVHGDFNIHNVLVDQGHISVILDWECAGFGAPEQDLAYIKPHISEHIAWDKFLAHYLAHGGREPDERTMNFGMAYAALRASLAANHATLNLQNGDNNNLSYTMVELGFTPLFMQLALKNAN